MGHGGESDSVLMIALQWAAFTTGVHGEIALMKVTSTARLLSGAT